MSLKGRCTSTETTAANLDEIKVFMDQINQKEKTLVFCAAQDHALAVRDLINQMKQRTDPNHYQRVTANDGELGKMHLRNFQDNEKSIPTSESELRAIWSVPGTRKQLLAGLAEKGFGVEQLAEMQQIIDAEKSDIYDGLAHVAYALTSHARGTCCARENSFA